MKQRGKVQMSRRMEREKVLWREEGEKRGYVKWIDVFVKMHLHDVYTVTKCIIKQPT